MQTMARATATPTIAPVLNCWPPDWCDPSSVHTMERLKGFCVPVSLLVHPSSIHTYILSLSNIMRCNCRRCFYYRVGSCWSEFKRSLEQSVCLDGIFCTFSSMLCIKVKVHTHTYIYICVLLSLVWICVVSSVVVHSLMADVEVDLALDVVESVDVIVVADVVVTVDVAVVDVVVVVLSSTHFWSSARSWFAVRPQRTSTSAPPEAENIKRTWTFAQVMLMSSIYSV